MYLPSHFFIPIIATHIGNAISLSARQKPLVVGRPIFLIGFAGLLPDLLNPHLLLVDRFESWTHTVWFLAGCGILGFSLKRFCNPWLIAFMLLAIFLHIACDAITGGVKLFWPYDFTVGKYLIGSNHWLQLDAITTVGALISYLVVWKMRKA